jgi:hypothetical protein
MVLKKTTKSETIENKVFNRFKKITNFAKIYKQPTLNKIKRWC